MAMNPYGPYDPFVGEVPNEFIENTTSAGSVIREAVNPLNWIKWKYQYDPTAWGGGLISTSKGLWSPFGKKLQGKGKLRELFSGERTIFDTYKSQVKRFGKGFGGTYKAITGTLKTRIGGSTRIGADIVPAAKRAARGSRAFKTSIEKNLQRRFRKLSGFDSYRLSRALAADLEEIVIAANGKLSQKALNKFVTERSKSQLVQEMGLTPEAFKNIVKTKSSKLSSAAGISSLAKRHRVDQSARLAGVKAVGMRLGMLAGKAFAYYGIVSTMWDLTKMVSEPIGRYLVENANRVATEFGQRYSPEMGGKIAMSYMTSGAATERQRAVEAISRSYINGRAALGNEAQFLHS